MILKIGRGSSQVTLNIFHFIVILLFLPYSELSPRCNGGCCPDYYMDYSQNDCIPCKKGYFGLNCAFRCTLPSYGRRCLLKCNCSNDRCHFQNGCLHFSTDRKIKTEKSTHSQSTILAFDPKSEENFKQDDVNQPKSPCYSKYKKKWTKTKKSLITVTILLFGFAFFMFVAYLKICKAFQERGAR
ncbi:uncharacterized protein LOC134263330 isoform X2 [Saccostrea cucullata]|uniref:uncharacterized protein LOC134263330 isoform X2 n=1 Tax=Saccostrea cuccullata TaxID=36930 RepID=UPI002ED0462D